MNRLHNELQRLYLPAPGAWTAADGRVRAAMLELVVPADAALLGAVWAGVQNELGLPAPAIVLSGHDGLQLWFSLQQPVEAALARSLVDGMRRRWLDELPTARWRGWPAPDAEPPALPGAEVGPERWAAVVSPDLAPLFTETPWLELPPGDDAQASLLAPLRPITPGELAEALRQLAPPDPAPGAPEPRPAPEREAERFLLAVMRDAAAPLAQRIEAAKALLQRG
ncbi:hypothetical protein [Rubrivivax gelatinosus]|uniref:Uncharacterized protein n=1 Tax=Rubrivivax gelatinosus TaxID=28068 RepID=A0A4R2MQQ0_RUBGE|nr:hypothetical protein [Rubrivivax gelatinosus]MBK1687865.1 hypothetical protein [Rubrivivax gelatinosus]TCP01713.1 hypothetical protein EV684_10852 [Rubrivivax gelatinosus]